MEEYNEYFIRIWDGDKINPKCIETHHHYTKENLFKDMQELHNDKKQFTVFTAKCVLDFS